jgi:hypothetical protein
MDNMGHLGEAKRHIEQGHVPGGKIEKRTQGTSNTLDESAGDVEKKGTNEKY